MSKVIEPQYIDCFQKERKVWIEHKYITIAMYNPKTRWHHINRTNKNGYLIILLVMQMKGLFILHQIAFKGGIISPTFSLNCFPHSSFPLKRKQLRRKISLDKMPLGCNQRAFENITSQKKEKGFEMLFLQWYNCSEISFHSFKEKLIFSSYTRFNHHKKDFWNT